MSIEGSKTGIDYQSIADAYGYKPIPEGFQPISAVDVSIDWQAGAEQRQAQQYGAVSVLNSLPKIREKPEKATITSNVPTTNGDFHFNIETWSSSRYLKLSLVNEKDQEIAYYLSTRRAGNVWDLGDRITSEAYRGKGVASHMIEATENCVQAIANVKGEDQEIVMEAGQLPVLSVFLNNGYNVVDEDKQRFAEVMGRLQAGDKKYVLASCEADFQENREHQKTWYVFERVIYERMGDEIWKNDPSHHKAYYMQCSVRFKLRKKIKAKSDDIIDEVAQVRVRVSSLGE